jgi:hypothetical protein
LVNLLSRHPPVLLEFKTRLRLLHSHDTCFVPESRWIHYSVSYRKNQQIPITYGFIVSELAAYFHNSVLVFTSLISKRKQHLLQCCQHICLWE